MIAEIRIAFLWGVIGVFEKLRIITEGDADRHRDFLVSVIRIENLMRREKERESWPL